MPYCYCSPNRNLRGVFAPGATVPAEEGRYMWRPDTLAMGTKGTWVNRNRRNASIRGWETRRRNLAAKASAATKEAEAEPVVFVPFIIDTPTPAPEEVTLSPEFLNTLLEVGD